MMAAISPVELAWLAAGIALAGVITGLLAGLFGVGGGAIIVPVLYEMFRIIAVPDVVRMQLCVGTSLAIILPTTLRSYRAHRAKGMVLRGVMRAWAAPSVAGVALGAIIAAFAPSAVFKIAFVVIAGTIAMKLLFGRENWVIADDLPRGAGLAAYGFVVGLGSSLMGISGGSITTLILTLHCKPIHNAVATASGVGVPITIAGTIGYALAGLPHQALVPPFSLGFVSAIGFVLIAPISSYVAPFGARLAHALPKRRLEIAFGIFLLLASARFLADLA